MAMSDQGWVEEMISIVKDFTKMRGQGVGRVILISPRIKKGEWQDASSQNHGAMSEERWSVKMTALGGIAGVWFGDVGASAGEL